MERAVWWTEYVIRHKGAPYFRSPTVQMPSYQYYLLDVLGVTIAAAAIVLFSFYRLLRLFIAKALPTSSSIKYKTS